MKKLTVLASAAIGYVLGTRAGRERYEQIKGAATKVRNNPTVQEKTQQAADLAREKAPQVADTVKDKVSGVTAAAGDKLGSSDPTSKLHPDSTSRQDDPYPQGDLP